VLMMGLGSEVRNGLHERERPRHPAPLGLIANPA
jgi:hypothetical protein